MEFNNKKLDDGTLELTVRIRPEEAEKMGGESGSRDTEGIGKTEYCVTCRDNSKHNIEAYGDIHANIIALSICRGSYSLRSGRC